MAMVTVVDDDFSVRESLEGLIRSIGMKVTTFASAEDFLGSAAFCKADCYIFDISLPGMSGIELRRELAARSCRVPVIFITAHASDDDARSAANSESTVAYLIKPFSEDDLLTAVDAALNWKDSSHPPKG